MFTRFSKAKLAPTPKGMLLAFIGFTAFAFSDVVSKWLTDDYSSFQIVFINHTMAAVCILAILPFFGGFGALKKTRKIKIHLLRGILNTCVALSVIYSFSILPLADVYALIFTVPFFSALLAKAFYGQKICANRMLAILIGFFGVLVALRPGTEGFNPWLLLPVLSGFLIALKFTISRSLEGENILSLGLWPLLISAPIAGLLSMGDFQAVPTAHFALHAFAGLCIAIALIFVSQAFRTAPAAAVSPILYTEMIWALAMGYLIFADVPDMWMMIGAGIIILSGLYLVETERRDVAEPP